MKIVKKLALITLLFSMASLADTPGSTWQLFTRSIGTLKREDIATTSLVFGICGGLYGAGLLTTNPFVTKKEMITTGILGGLMVGASTAIWLSMISDMCANK